jgi:hypothetical protein
VRGRTALRIGDQIGIGIGPYIEFQSLTPSL